VAKKKKVPHHAGVERNPDDGRGCRKKKGGKEGSARDSAGNRAQPKKKIELTEVWLGREGVVGEHSRLVKRKSPIGE